MPIYSQDEEYNEPEEPDTYNEPPMQQKKDADEDSEESKESFDPSKLLKKLNMKVVACIVGVIILLILILMVVAWADVKKQKKAAADIAKSDLKTAQELEDYYQSHPDERPEPGEDAPIAQASTEYYSIDETRILRKWGYTASELDITARDHLSATELVKQARKDREAAQKEALDAVRDTASPEYQALLNKTWLGGDSLDLSGVQVDSIYNTAQRTENVDYEKCGAQGTQLFLKLQLDNGTSAFMTVTPVRYLELAESGNIVVSIEQVEYGETTVIISIQEVRVD